MSEGSPADLSRAHALLDALWRDYVAITPQAETIHTLLGQRGERFRNDHIALRTFALPEVSLDRLAAPWRELGWEPSGEYEFPEKKLFARSFTHPSGALPRVFISELLLEHFDAQVQDLARALVHGLGDKDPWALLQDRPSWPAPSVSDYRALLERSEYAAWLAAFGLRANHFTVDFNDLKTFASLEALNAFLEGAGFSLNGSGRKIQGSPEALLEQSSTLASIVPWTFAGGESLQIPSCYYEFARRYPDPETGALFDGFVARSADKIFESTDVRHRAAT